MADIITKPYAPETKALILSQAKRFFEESYQLIADAMEEEKGCTFNIQVYDKGQNMMNFTWAYFPKENKK